MSTIKNVIGRMIIDSRGNPTVEAEVYIANGIYGRAAVPSGASTGSKEALELRDNATLFHGLGVEKALKNVNLIKDSVIGLESSNQLLVDNTMLNLDGTTNKSNLGANAILAVSLANLQATAKENGVPLYKYLGGCKIPRPMMNIINGGAHANNALSVQEFMIVPKGESFKDIMSKSVTVFGTLKMILKEKNQSTNVGDEGGFAPNLSGTEEALDLIIEAINRSNYKSGVDFELALDIAASEFYDENNKIYNLDGRQYTTDELLKYYEVLVEKYPIISLEDPFAENDYEGFQKITALLGSKIMIVGDDLFVTNEELLKQGIINNQANAILIKPNQIGSYSEMLNTIKLAKAHNFKTIISHRSGETEDTIISHFGVGLETDFIKTGSLSRSERVAKYNELLRIEEELKRGDRG